MPKALPSILEAVLHSNGTFGVWIVFDYFEVNKRMIKEIRFGDIFSFSLVHFCV